MRERKKSTPTRPRRYAWPPIAVALLIVAALTAPATSDAACGVCNLHLTHRTGAYAIHLTSNQPAYRIGQPVIIQLTIANHGTAPIFVDPSNVVRHFTLHIIAPNYKGTVQDSPVATSGQRVAPGQTLTLPPTRLAYWGVSTHRPGKYRANISYGPVDSNTLTFIVH